MSKDLAECYDGILLELENSRWVLEQILKLLEANATCVPEKEIK